MAGERIKRQIDRLLDEAEQASEREGWATVLNRVQRVVTFDPSNVDAEGFLAAAERALSTQPTVSGNQVSPSPSSGPFPAPSETPLPTSFASGRYEVKRFLGEGGKKKVYMAHDTTLDRDVAFALIKTEGLDEAGRIRVQREAQAMDHLDFAIGEIRDMKMQPSSERALRQREILRA